MKSAFAGSGLFFDISSTGTSSVNINTTLCLNGKGPLSCQNYMVSGSCLTIKTTIPNHTYPSVGIKINTPGFIPQGCMPISNGYCLFSVSDANPTTVCINENNRYVVGGSISGLTTSGLILQNNGVDNLTVPSDATYFNSRPRCLSEAAITSRYNNNLLT